MRSQSTRVRQAIAVLTISIFWLVDGTTAAAGDVKSYSAKYYTVSSDLTPEEVRGILLRLDCLIPEFNQNFPALRGAITHKFNVQIFRSSDAFHAAGAPANFNGSFYHRGLHKVFILVTQDFERVVQGMQQLCFLQFCNEAIANDQPTIPEWVLAALARHFYRARFTGDGYVCGLIPPRMVEDAQQQLLAGRYRDVTEVMAVTREQMIGTEARYYSDEAWWVSHYLDSGENGIRHEAFSKYLHDVARGISHNEAWGKAFGDLDINRSWRAWMMAQKPEIMNEGYAQVFAETLAAYLGRAAISGQRYTQVTVLVNAIKTNSIRIADADWLPPELPSQLDQWMILAGPETKFEISTNTKTPQVIATLPDRTRITATFDPERKGPRTTAAIEGPGHPKTIATPNRPDDAGTATIVLKSARFGAGNSWVDVTEKCRNMLVGDMLLAPRKLAESFEINPAQGGINQLELHLVVNGAAVRVIVADNLRMPTLRLTTRLPAAADE